MLGPLKLVGELLVGGPAVQEPLVDGPADLLQSAGLYDRLEQGRDVFGERLARSGGTLG